MNNFINDFIQEAQAKTPHEQPGDYVIDGIWYCGKCHTPKQACIDILGRKTVVWALCQCAGQEYRDNQARIKAEEESRRLRSSAFPERQLQAHRFETSDPCPAIDVGKQFVANWETFRTKGRGLLLYGENSRGKTHVAACIVNALIDRGVPCLITNFERLINELDAEWQHRQDIIDGLNRFQLLVIDDLGAERDDSRKRGVIYNIIDSRVMSKQPLIITTNLTGEDMRKPKCIDNARIYERIFEACHPVKVEGPNRRREIMQAAANEFDSLLGIIKRGRINDDNRQ